jgi:hypothetical protein
VSAAAEFWFWITCRAQATERNHNRDHERSRAARTTLDSAGAISEAEAGDDGAEFLAEAVDEAVQGGQVVGLDSLDPPGQMPALRLSRSLTDVG